jgi:biopolymer transport protein ExbD
VIRASRALVLLSLALAGCRSKSPTFRAACAVGSADACEILSARLLLGEDGPPDEAEAATFGKRAYEIRLKACAAGDKDACDKLAARGVFIATKPLDAARPPPSSGVTDADMVLAVEVHADLTTFANDRRMADDNALRAAAREGLGKFPDLRAVIRADTSVPHGRVIQVLDILKEADIGKIAFGVAPIAPAPR